MSLENIVLNERSQTQRATYYSTYMKYPEQANLESQKFTYWLPGAAEREKWGQVLNAHGIVFWGDEDILVLDIGGGCTAL